MEHCKNTVFQGFNLFVVLLLNKCDNLSDILFFPDFPCSVDRTRPSYLSSLKMVMCHVPYQRLVLGFAVSVLAFQVQFKCVVHFFSPLLKSDS